MTAFAWTTRSSLRLLAPAALLVAGAAAAAVAPPAPVEPVPTPQQLAWQRMELTMFLHFGVNTFTDREWGEGKEDPAIFNPAELDCGQWARTAKAAGFKLMILTAKHHDGFCLWPSKYTDHCVKSSHWRDGKGDVVRAFTDACRAEGLGVGIYLSPWDRHEPTYGDSDKYNAHFRDQLAELMTNYGRVDEVWFDGACGEGPNGKKQVYDWKSTYETAYRCNPKAVIAICGPDVRWVGNESGVARAGESSVQPSAHGRADASGKPVWYPAECDVSIRPGWFYHASQDGQVKSLEHLLDLYFKSVGRNSVLLLNVPPDRRGRLADPDVKRLAEFGRAVGDMLGSNLARGGTAAASGARGSAHEFAPAQACDGDLDTYWSLDDGATNGWLEVAFKAPVTFNVVNVQEAIRLGERVQKYHVEAQTDGAWRTIGAGTVIGQRNLLRVGAVTASAARLVIDGAKACPAIAEFGLLRSDAAGGAAGGSGALTAHKPATCSNVHPSGTVFGGDKAVDDDNDTRWATSDETRACWLEVDLQGEYELGRVGLRELTPRITKFEVQYRLHSADAWSTAYAGTKAGTGFSADFPPVRARAVRLNILEATSAPTIWEFQVFPPPAAK